MGLSTRKVEYERDGSARSMPTTIRCFHKDDADTTMMIPREYPCWRSWGQDPLNAAPLFIYPVINRKVTRLPQGDTLFMQEVWEEKTAWERNSRKGVVFAQKSQGNSFQEVLHCWLDVCVEALADCCSGFGENSAGKKTNRTKVSGSRAVLTKPPRCNRGMAAPSLVRIDCLDQACLGHSRFIFRKPR